MLLSGMAYGPDHNQQFKRTVILNQNSGNQTIKEIGNRMYLTEISAKELTTELAHF